MRLLLLSFCCCALQRQEALLKGGVENGARENEREREDRERKERKEGRVCHEDREGEGGEENNYNLSEKRTKDPRTVLWLPFSVFS